MNDATAHARDLIRLRHPHRADAVFATFAASLFVDLVTRSPINGQDMLVGAANRALVDAGSTWRIAERVTDRVQ